MRLFVRDCLYPRGCIRPGCDPGAGRPASARRVRADVEFLASDSLEGRDTGSKGYAIAADYVASQFRAIGLEPAGEKGSWFQQVPFRRASFDKPPTLTLTVGGKRIALEQGKDAALRPSVTDKVAPVQRRLRVRRLWPEGRALSVRRLSRAQCHGGRSRLP